MGQLYPPSQNWRPNAIPNTIPNDLYFSNKPELNLNSPSTGVIGFITRGPLGTGMYIEWGDGSNIEWIAHLGNSTNVATNHDYLGLPGTKYIKLTGRIDLFTYFTCNYSTVYGDISEFKNAPSLEYIKTNGSSISGNIGELKTLTNLTSLFLYNTSVSGNIDELKTLVNVTFMYIYNTSISGNIGELKTLTNVVYLQLHNTSVSGDLGELKTLTSAILLRLDDTSIDYNTTTLTAWNDTVIKIQDCAFTSTEVDNFLIDLAAAGGTNGTLNIAGTNAARTSASDAAKATLLSNGWAITVNE